MRYFCGVALVLFVLVAASPLWAADETASNFYALRELPPVQPDSRGLKAMSDAQLETVEGSSRLSGWTHHGRNGQLRERMLTFLMFRLLGELLRGGGLTSQTGQNNFLIQLNVAIGNSITQINNAVQYNISSATQHTR